MNYTEQLQHAIKLASERNRRVLPKRQTILGELHESASTSDFDSLHQLH